MGVLAQIPGIVDTALTQAFGDGIVAATLIKRGAPVSDGRGGRTESGSSAEHECRGLLTNYSDFARGSSGGAITIRDRKALILGASLPAGVTPEENDRLEIDGTTWLVVNVSRDPAKATYKLQLRPAKAA